MRSWPTLQSIHYYRDVFSPTKYFNDALNEQRTPIFIYHDLEPQEFESHLKFLKNNGYEAVACEDKPWETDDKKKVILSFDDGRRSVWTVAYPLLRKYGFRGTAFISPGIIPDEGITPTIENGNIDTLVKHDFGNAELFSWKEARVMHDSGIIDLQLHGFAHSRIFVSNKIIDFERPERWDRNRAVSAWQIQRDTQDIFLNKLKPGQPIYENDSRWGIRPRYFDNEELSELCVQFVQDNGGEVNFFQNKYWRQQLLDITNKYQSSTEPQEKFESPTDTQENLLYLLSKAKDILESKIEKPIEHFALPWAKGDARLVSEIANKIEIKHIYWAYHTKKELEAFNGTGSTHHRRIKDIFLLRLSGCDRQSILQLLFSEYLRIKQDKKDHQIIKSR